MLIDETNGLGRIVVREIPLPDYMKSISGTYTYSGKVLVQWREKEGVADTYLNLAIMNDDGTDIRTIYSEDLSKKRLTNEFRLLPFYDNKRILLGDFILECTPDIDHCEHAELLPLIYPEFIMEDPGTRYSWTEVIVAPDNVHVSWTTIDRENGAVNYIGALKRLVDAYIIENVQIISTQGELFIEDKDREGYMIPQVRRGGEVKQFIRGGRAISLAGSLRAGTLDSIVQALDSEELIRITNSPSYEETTIFSPDEQLGIVMSTRDSQANTSIFGLLPRPLVYSTESLYMPFYMYAVDGVRSFREGNIGPVLIEIKRSVEEPDYRGILLSDREEKWVYYSPMSWHPDGRKAMWNEGIKQKDRRPEGRNHRLRIVELPDYQPKAPVPVTTTPLTIPYGIPASKDAIRRAKDQLDIKIAGKYHGYIEYKKKKTGNKNSTQTIYHNYSDDGKIYFNGYETVLIFNGTTCYEADLEMRGADRGEMKFRVIFEPLAGRKGIFPQVVLSFDQAGDGRPKSYGYATYQGITYYMDDMPV